MRHEEVPLQTVISLKTINKSSVGNSDKIVGYELELQKDPRMRAEGKPRLNLKEFVKLSADRTGQKNE